MTTRHTLSTAEPEPTPPLPAPTWLPAIVVSVGIGLLAYRAMHFTVLPDMGDFGLVVPAVVAYAVLIGYTDLLPEGLYAMLIFSVLFSVFAGYGLLAIFIPYAMIVPHSFGMLLGVYMRYFLHLLGFCDKNSKPTKLWVRQFSLRAMFAATTLVALLMLPLSLWVDDWGALIGAWSAIGGAWVATFVTITVSKRLRGQLARTAQRRLP